MAFFQLVLKARSLEKARLVYEDEKLRSIEISRGAKPRYTLRQRLRRKKLRCKRRVKDVWDKVTSCPEDSWIHERLLSIRTDGTFDNYVLKSIVGFFGGVLLTYVFFFFFVFQLNFKLSSAMMLCTVIGVILTLGLAFSHRVRCVVFLLLPQFFSKRGRQALMAYAFILALTGPAKNTLHNIGVLSESLACAQEQLKEAVKVVIDLIKQPFYALREAISKVIKMVRVVVKRIKETLVAIKRLVLSILRVITSVFQWLGSIVNICNKKLGTPFDRCQRVFEGAVADCKAKLGPIFGGICNLAYIVSALCYIVKPLDFICMLVSYVADTVVDAVRRKIKRFAMHVKAMFYVKVKFSHSFHFETNQSKTIGEVSRGIVTEIRSRTDKFLAVFDWMSFLTAFFIVFMLLRVIHYRQKWLTSERFDNRYLTQDLRTIDLIRARQEKETVLPLNQRERNRYIPLNSIILIKSEKIKLAKSAIFLGLTTFKLVMYMMVDYSLYWILSTIRFHGRFETKVQRPNVVDVHVSGDGYLAELYRSIVRAFTPRGRETEIDTMPCLPDPIPPDMDRYTQIVSLIVLCWLLAFFEPYGLRLRHVVMCHYHPDRAKQRAAWLYNHILRSRGSFLKFARRQLRRKFGMTEGEKIEKVTLRERLTAMCPILNVLFPQKQKVCLLCGAVERDDKNPHIKCATPGCLGLFCTQCFADLQNLCTICRSPVEYGDLSDMSEEKDSSEDQQQALKEKKAEPEVEIVEGKKSKEKIEVDEEEKEEEEEEEEEETIKEREDDDEKTEKEEKTDVREKDETETVDKAIEVDRSSESSYSYGYQDESPTEVEVIEDRKPFKDVEAQKSRDDVTIQIFREPPVKETCSSTSSPTSCFVLHARRRIRARLTKKSVSPSPGRRDSGSSTSIADTESWPTEELDEEEVIHIEAGDCEELLPKDRKDKGKRGRINRIVGAVSRIPWLGRGDKIDGSTDRDSRTGRRSLVERIVDLLRGNRKVRSRRCRRIRRGRRRKEEDTSSSTSSSYEEDENETLIKDGPTGGRLTRRKRVERQMDDDSEEDMSSGSHETLYSDSETEDVNLRRFGEKKFATKRLPRYLETISRGTSYCEVDETEDSRKSRRCMRPVEDVNALSDARTSSDGRKTRSWNITADEETSCSCTSGMAYDTSVDKTVRSFGMSTISERSDDVSKSGNDSETVEASTISQNGGENTDETESVERSPRKRGFVKEIPGGGGRTEESTYSEEGRVVKEIPAVEKKVEDSTDYEESKDSREIGEKRTSKVDEGAKTQIKKEEEKKVTRKGRGADVRPEKPDLYDPLAGLELYGVKHKSKKRVKPVEDREIEDEVEKKTEGLEKIEGTKETTEKVEELKSDTMKGEIVKLEETEKKGSIDKEIRPKKVDKATDLPDKSRGTQTTFRRSVSDKETDRIKQTDTETSEQPKITKIPEDTEEERKKSPPKKPRRKRHVEDLRISSKRRNYKSSEKSTVTDEDESRPRERKRKRRYNQGARERRHRGSSTNEEESPGAQRRRYSNDRGHEDFRAEDRAGYLVSGFRPIIRAEEMENVDDRGDFQVERATSCTRRFDPGLWPHDSRSRTRQVPCTGIDEYPEYEYFERRYPENYENIYPGYEYRDRNYIENIPRNQRIECRQEGPQDYEMQRRQFFQGNQGRPVRNRYEIPRIRKYLPMYQNPDLIEELKGHDRMRLIREREGRRWRTSDSRTVDDVSMYSRTREENANRISTASTKLEEEEEEEEEEDHLPYQETEAYKNVMGEFRRRTVRNRNKEEDEESVPLIALSKRADKTKEVKQLFPADIERRPSFVSKFTDKISNAFKPCSNKKEECKVSGHEVGSKRMIEICPSRSFGLESSSEASSPCDCSRNARRSGISSSTDETTDNNKSTL